MSRRFRFIHAADLHIDSPMRGLSKLQEEDLAEKFRGAARRAFERLVTLALESEVSFVLLAGDISDQGWHDSNTAVFFNRQVARLTDAGIRLLLVWGNHDIKGPVAKLPPKHPLVHLFPSNKAETFPLPDLGVAVHGRSLSRSIQQKNLAGKFPRRVEGAFNIGLLHTSLDGREGHDPYAPCSLDDLLSRDYEYWALGHVHSHELVLQEPWVVFSGCIQGRHVRETGPKGAVLVEVEDAEVRSLEFRELDLVRWAQETVDVTGLESIEEVRTRVVALGDALVAEAGDRPLAVRLGVRGAGAMVPDMIANPWGWEDRFREWIAGAGAGRVVIEQVKFELEAVQGGADSSLPRNVVQEIVARIRALPEDPASIRSMALDGKPGGMEKHLEKLFGKLGTAKVRELVPSDQEVQQLMVEAKQRLVARFLTLGEDEPWEDPSDDGRRES